MNSTHTVLTIQEVRIFLCRLIDRIISENRKKGVKVFGIPRGGTIVALATDPQLIPVENIEDADVVIDDIYDSGATYRQWKDRINGKPFYVLIDKRLPEFAGKWIEFPWEHTAEKETQDHVIRILEMLGEDVTREGLIDTPKRYLKFLNEFTHPKEIKMTTFDAENYDQMIVQSSIPFYSICEHHMVPFFGTAAVGYIPDGKIVGLSKLARLVDWHARKLQNQERITQQVCSDLERILSPRGVGVVITARHLCMEMRGIKKAGATTTTTAVSGIIKEDDKARSEFLQYAKG